MAAPPSCVDVAVNGHAVLAYDCLSRRLAAPERSAVHALAVDAVTRLPSNQQVGQFNFSAFSHRMGDSLGRSVQPQRPPPVPSPPLRVHVSTGVPGS